MDHYGLQKYSSTSVFRGVLLFSTQPTHCRSQSGLGGCLIVCGKAAFTSSVSQLGFQLDL